MKIFIYSIQAPQLIDDRYDEDLEGNNQNYPKNRLVSF